MDHAQTRARRGLLRPFNVSREDPGPRTVLSRKPARAKRVGITCAMSAPALHRARLRRHFQNDNQGFGRQRGVNLDLLHI